MNDLVATASQLIHCPADQAFDAFADPGKITRFWLDSASAPLSRGARVTWGFMVPGAVETVVVDEFEPPGLIAFTWSDGVKVRLVFSAHAAGGTEVSAQARGFSGDDAAQQAIGTTEGFSIVLCDLKTFLESGRSAGLVRAKADLIAAGMAAGQSAA